MAQRKGSVTNTIKVVFMGSAKVGKTSIIQRILGRPIKEAYEPTIFEYYNCCLEINKQRICLEISDTSGTLQFPAMEKLAREQADVIVVVFDLGNADTYTKTKKLVEDIVDIDSERPVIFVGNKSDRTPRMVETKNEIESYILCNFNKSYIELSVKNDENVQNLLNRIFEDNEISKGPYNIRKTSKISRFKRRLSKTLTF